MEDNDFNEHKDDMDDNEDNATVKKRGKGKYLLHTLRCEINIFKNVGKDYEFIPELIGASKDDILQFFSNHKDRGMVLNWVFCHFLKLNEDYLFKYAG